jgi:DNA-binding response OmpR family regulator
MSLTVILAVGLDSWKLTAQSSVLRSAGYIVVSAHSIRDVIEHFKAGDFDLVMLDHSISLENKERLTSLIRASGSRTPVVSVLQSSSDSHSIGDANPGNESFAVITGMEELLARRSGMSVVQTTLRSDEHEAAVA